VIIQPLRALQSQPETYEFFNPTVVMFDLDGTLIDTMNGFADLAAELIHRNYQWDTRLARKRYLETSGIPFRQQLDVIFPADPRNDEVASEYESRKEVVCQGILPNQDTLETLELLRSWQIRLVVSSNSAQHFVDDFQREVAFTFDLALGYGHGLAKGEPHVRLVCQHFAVNPLNILFVGDSLKDAELAQSCGCHFVARLGTFRRGDFLKAYPRIPAVNTIGDLRFLVAPCK
jgi:HAD superfamily hydrolase (TIGR01549 family)